jgi:hypothetical protein
MFENQGCQKVSFQTKNIIMGIFWRALEKKKIGILYGHLKYFTSILLY